MPIEISAREWQIGLSLVSAIFACAISANAAAKSNGWIVERFDQTAGRVTVRCGEPGYSSVHQNIGYNTVASPPSWSVCVTNPGKKLYFVASKGTEIKQVTGLSLIKLASIGVTAELKWQRAGSTTYLGHPIAIWRAATGKTLVTVPADRFDGFEFWAAEDIPIPASVAAFSHSVHGYPPVKFLPIRYLRRHTHRKTDVILETNSIKPANLPADIFQIPKDYKKAKNEADVGTNTQNLQMIIEGLDTKSDKLRD